MTDVIVGVVMGFMMGAVVGMEFMRFNHDTIQEAEELKQECESTLPRNVKCVMQYVEESRDDN